MKDLANRPDELLDRVDKNDVVIGTTPRGQAQQDPTVIHREIWVLLYDDQNQLLFQKRSLQNKNRPGYWAESCAGHVPAGQDPDVAAHRELQEELGFDTNLTFVEKFLDRRPTETRFINFYLGKYAGEKVVLEPAEVEAVQLCTQADYERIRKEGDNFGPVAEGLIDRFWNGEFDSYKVQ